MLLCALLCFLIGDFENKSLVIKNAIIWKIKKLVTWFYDFRKLYLINVNLSDRMIVIN